MSLSSSSIKKQRWLARLVPRMLSAIISGIMIATMAFLVLPTIPVQATRLDEDFTIVVFPDTQYEVQLYPAVWQSMADWVVANKETYNIKAVLGVGDIVQNVGVAAEWAEAVKGWDKIKNAGIPYLPVIGNHDYNDQWTKEVTTWSTHFGTNYFTGQSWFGGTYNGTTDNYFISLEIGSKNFLIFALEMGPTASVLAWAQTIVEVNPDATVIVSTHKYLWSSLAGGVTDLRTNPEGRYIWNNFVKINSNIRVVLSGDAAEEPHTSFLLSNNDAGSQVGQLKFNYQWDTNGGNGYMGLLTFRPLLGQVGVQVYSPYLDGYDLSVQYFFDYSQVAPGGTNGDGVVDVLDLTRVARIILLLDAKTTGSDVNLDGVVDVLDLTKIVRLILGQSRFDNVYLES